MGGDCERDPRANGARRQRTVQGERRRCGRVACISFTPPIFFLSSLFCPARVCVFFCFALTLRITRTGQGMALLRCFGRRLSLDARRRVMSCLSHPIACGRETVLFFRPLPLLSFPATDTAGSTTCLALPPFTPNVLEHQGVDGCRRDVSEKRDVLFGTGIDQSVNRACCGEADL